MISKKDLIHGAYYHGKCSNANVARWNAETSRFYYIEQAFSIEFISYTKHPEDDESDPFVPEYILTKGIKFCK